MAEHDEPKVVRGMALTLVQLGPHLLSEAIARMNQALGFLSHDPREPWVTRENITTGTIQLRNMVGQVGVILPNGQELTAEEFDKLDRARAGCEKPFEFQDEDVLDVARRVAAAAAGCSFEETKAKFVTPGEVWVLLPAEDVAVDLDDDPLLAAVRAVPELNEAFMEAGRDVLAVACPEEYERLLEALRVAALDTLRAAEGAGADDA